MVKKVKKAGDYMLFVVGILLISFMVNVFMSISNYKVKYRVGKESCGNIEKIKSLNDSNVAILDRSLELGSISNMELLKLYKNYSDISNTTIKLWDEYSFYENNRPIFNFRKHMDVNKNVLNDVNSKIEEYLLAISDKEMKTQSYKLELNGITLENFKNMKNLSKEVGDYYNTFYEKYLVNVTNEDRVKKIIKNYYWIDMLEGLNKINENYIDGNFVLEQ